jgi:hypothetical protein
VSSCVQGLAAYADGLEEMATRYAETDAVVGASFRLAGQGG